MLYSLLLLTTTAPFVDTRMIIDPPRNAKFVSQIISFMTGERGVARGEQRRGDVGSVVFAAETPPGASFCRVIAVMSFEGRFNSNSLTLSLLPISV